MPKFLVHYQWPDKLTDNLLCIPYNIDKITEKSYKVSEFESDEDWGLVSPRIYQILRLSFYKKRYMFKRNDTNSFYKTADTVEELNKILNDYSHLSLSALMNYYPYDPLYTKFLELRAKRIELIKEEDRACREMKDNFLQNLLDDKNIHLLI